MQTLENFCLENGVSSISKVRSNVNGLKYSTFIINGEAVNVYFSKRASEKVSVNGTAETFKTMLVSLVDYEDGRESRYKLSIGGDDFTSVGTLFK